jgi:hypothetical protein
MCGQLALLLIVAAAAWRGCTTCWLVNLAQTREHRLLDNS